MYKLTASLLILAFLSFSCDSNNSQTTPKNMGSPSPTTEATPSAGSLESPPPKNLLDQALERDPKGKVLQQANNIRDRLRYFGEELKTTHKPDKQKALMEDVRRTLQPACREIEIIIPTTILYTDKNVNDFLALCYKLDKALATHDPKALPPILKDFNSTFDSLQASLSEKPKE